MSVLLTITFYQKLGSISKIFEEIKKDKQGRKEGGSRTEGSRVGEEIYLGITK
jgi:hypothetical protein